MDNQLQTTSNLALIESLPAELREQAKMFEIIIQENTSGIKSMGQAILLYQRTKELGLGWANAIPHMHIINNKAGIDIHILRAILLKAEANIEWELVNDFKPQYRYMDESSVVYTEDLLPPFAYIIPTFKKKDECPSDKVPFAYAPTITKNGEKSIIQYIPYSNKTTYKFTRTQKTKSGKTITRVEYGEFSSAEAWAAGLNLNKEGNIAEASPWTKYLKLMVDTRAFTFGARKIASDLLMGCYEMSELFDIEKKNYNITEDGTATVIDN